MTKKIIDGVIIERLRAAADRLAKAPTETWERADAHAKLHGHASKAPHQAGALEQICRNESAILGDLAKMLEVAS